MNSKTNILIVFFAALFIGASAQKTTSATNRESERKVDELLKQMTVEEKIGQLNLISIIANTGPAKTKDIDSKIRKGAVGNIFSLLSSPKRMYGRIALADSTRLKIPLLNGLDIIHGYKTIFPVPLGLSCSWDMDVIESTARVAAVEASSMGYNWTFSPMADLTRDPRWGRVMEGSGEDTYLGSLITAAMVRGYHGKGLADIHSLMTCVKHFALYGAAEAGRDYNTVEMGLPAMCQYHLPLYKAAIDEGAFSVMAAFNTINGVPATSNQWLLTEVLRKQWGFEGFVVSDYNAINELIEHGVANDAKEAAEKAFRAGLDMDMMSEAYSLYLKELLREKKISIDRIDEACRKILLAKERLGLFENPFRGLDPENPSEVILTPENRRIAKEAALKSVVLLKNDNRVLPLKKDSRIALIGPFADDKGEMFSTWSFTGSIAEVVTIREGIEKINPRVTCVKGTQVTDDTLVLKRLKRDFDAEEQQKLEKEALLAASNSDVIVLALGESMDMSGEAKSFTDIAIQECQKKLLRKLRELNKPIVLLLVNGRPMTIADDLPLADAVLETWRLGTEAGSAIADILFGNYNPSGKLTMTFPRSVGQIPIYYNQLNTGRPFYEERGDAGLSSNFTSNYKDEYNTPLFPFGFGLSYTRFEYSEISLSDTILTGETDTLLVELTVSNRGDFAGEETVQLYLRDHVASISRPVKELKQFKKIILQPGEEKQVTFTITTQDLKFFNQELKHDWESGDFTICVGGNSQDVKASRFYWGKAKPRHRIKNLNT